MGTNISFSPNPNPLWDWPRSLVIQEQIPGTDCRGLRTHALHQAAGSGPRVTTGFPPQTWVDGGFTNSLPILPVGRTVTISPFCGRLDISPQDKGQLGVYVSIANQDILVSVANLVRLNQALFPPGQREMESLYRRGFRDAAGFLLKENWFE
ncbi:PREDICTED: patatin-like phospholipase domain-containing protein 4 [Myotis brandtii]|uniref:patatin-like phospholipase domain-containing protein 4 n=1 Tax=Myotis brandtii TaxID=109478 RepID=UPI0007046087|nr:PREDICTED: patatin-like phospholipase domain-containing protein 4 [Myotis brandtii]